MNSPVIDLSTFCVNNVRCMWEQHAGESYTRLRVSIEVTDIVRGGRTFVTGEDRVHSFGRDVPEDQKRRFVLKMVRNCVLRTLEHELDEQLFIDGVRPADPHGDCPNLHREDCASQLYTVIKGDPNSSRSRHDAERDPQQLFGIENTQPMWQSMTVTVDQHAAERKRGVLP